VCKFMKAGPCNAEYLVWDECMKGATEEDFSSKCFQARNQYVYIYIYIYIYLYIYTYIHTFMYIRRKISLVNAFRYVIDSS
jgi:hypothetical protein